MDGQMDGRMDGWRDDVFMFYQIFRSPQMKRGTIISNKQGIHELPQELQNDLRLKVLGNQEIRGISQNSTELQPRNQPHFQNDSFVNTAKKNAEKSKLNFSHSALFHMKTRVFLQDEPANLCFLCIKRLHKYCWVICISCTNTYSCKLYIITVNHRNGFSLFHFELL